LIQFAIVFPGQGSQYAGMGKKLYERYSIVRQTFEEASDAINLDIKSLCFNSHIAELTRTDNAQPAIFTLCVAAFRVFMQEIGVHPVYSAGHSLGELTALACSGAVNFSDGVKIARKRGLFMHKAASKAEGAMSAIIGVPQKQVEMVCRHVSKEDGLVVVSNYNSDNQFVISGYKKSVLEAEKLLKEKGALVKSLNVGAPFHSPLMLPVCEKLENELGKYRFNEMQWKVISNVNGLPYNSKHDIKKNLVKQAGNPVMWGDTIKFLKKNGVNTILEIGPVSILKNLIPAEYSIKSFFFKHDCNNQSLSEYLQHDSSDRIKPGKCYSSDVIIKCMSIAVSTKNFNYDNAEYMDGVAGQYEKIQKIQDEIDKAGRIPTENEVQEAIKALERILAAKKIDSGRIRELMSELTN
jgi:[acyl-carrier-protein] S-malonyltransferase